MAKITVPNNPEYNGIDFGVPFVNGVAETENAWLIAMFKENGYNVEEAGFEEIVEEVVEDIESGNLGELSRDDIKAQLDAAGIKYAKNAKTETLLEILEASKLGE